MTVSRDAVIELTRELVDRPSENPPGDEAAVAAFLRDRLASSPVPFDVEAYDVEPDRPNVVARTGAPDGPSLLLTGHTDVVPADPDPWSGDPYQMARSDGRLVGRGTADMKAALAAKLLAVEDYWANHDPAGEIVLAFVCGEERGGIGTEALVDRGIDADAAVIGEPTDLRVCVAEKGVARFEITTTGENAHSGRPDEGVNAIDGMRAVLDGIAALDRERRGMEHPLLTPETVTVTEIDGGIAPNVVPSEATITVDRRFHPGAGDREFFERQIRDVVRTATACEAVDVQVSWISFGRATETAVDGRIAETVRAAAEDVTGTGAVAGLNAITDAKFLRHDAEIPTVVFGPGSIEADAHTVDESVAVDDLLDAAAVYRRTIERFFEE